MRYYSDMIRSFKGKRSRAVFERLPCRGLTADVQRTAHRKLLILDAAGALQDLRIPPGNRLEKLTGDRAGRYSIRVNDRWRLGFVWKRGDAYDVEIVDYH